MDQQKLLVLTILLSPFIGFFIQALAGGRVTKTLGRKAAARTMGLLAVLAVAVPFVVALSMLLKYQPLDGLQVVTVGNWIDLASLKIPFELAIDPLSLTMILVITGIGALIHIYAVEYMREDRDFTRFFTYMNLFVGMMSLLVLANNIVLMFVGWEGVGLCSYLLIGFWYKDPANVKAANKAFIVNRVGDFGFMLGIFTLICIMASSHQDGARILSYDVMQLSINVFRSHPALTTVACLLLFVGMTGKSAQFPLYFWLPDAMAGPTPVSALIHAATMVTAGVFLLNRLSFLFVFSPVACAVITIVGAFTALYAGIIAFGQSDIKKVLAFSTVSQLGFMFAACGAGGFSAGLFHVVTHAFFKALLFLGAGAVIYAMAHEQDMRNYGGLWKYMKVTAITMWIAFLAISGLPPLSGYYSKEAILRAAMGGNVAVVNGMNFGQIAGYIALAAAILTGAYMARLTWLTFHGKEERWRKIDPASVHHAHEAVIAAVRPLPDPYGFYANLSEDEPEEEEAHHVLTAEHTPKEVPSMMLFPLVVLAIGSLVAGWFMERGNFQTWLSSTALSGAAPAEVPWLTTAGITAAVLGVVAGLLYYGLRNLPKAEGWDMSQWSWWRRVAGQQFGYDYLVTEGSSASGHDFAVFLSETFNKWLVDGSLGGLAVLTADIGKFLRKAHTGYVRMYAAIFFAGVLILVGWMFLSTRGVGF